MFWPEFWERTRTRGSFWSGGSKPRGPRDGIWSTGPAPQGDPAYNFRRFNTQKQEEKLMLQTMGRLFLFGGRGLNFRGSVPGKFRHFGTLSFDMCLTLPECSL